MGRRLDPLTLDNLSDLPKRCRSCVFWELDPVSGEAAMQAGKPELEKEAWISAVLLEWGSCGRVVYVDDVPAGFVLYAPPAYVPRSLAFPTSPVSSDAVQLMTSRILPGFQGQGLGRVLVQAVAKDLVRRGFKAIEAFGDAQWEEPGWASSLQTISPRWALRRCGHIRATPVCGSTCAPRSPGGRTWKWRSTGCSAPSRKNRHCGRCDVSRETSVGPSLRTGPTVMTESSQLMKSPSSRFNAAFGLAPTMVLTISPPW